MKVVIKRLLIAAFTLWALVVFSVLAAGTGLFFWHLGGLRAWTRWKAERIAVGDRFEWRQLMGADLADQDNFARAPLVAGAFRGEQDPDSPLLKIHLPETADKALGRWQDGRSDDLKALAKACGAPDMATALAPFSGVLAQLEAASRRTGCRSGVDYARGEMPQLQGFRGAARLLRVRAELRLYSGDGAGALEDTRTCLRMARHVGSEPCLLGGLLQQALVGIALQPVWDGLQAHRWTPAQLEMLQQELAALDLLAGWRLAIEGQRLQLAEGLSRAADGRPDFRQSEGGPEAYPTTPPGFLGRRWLYRNLLEQDRQIAKSQLGVLDIGAHRVHPEWYESSEAWARRLRWRKDLVLAVIASPSLDGQVKRVAAGQAMVDLAGVACALERHRLEQGAYPAGLEALAPRYLARIPRDLTTGGPLMYRRTDRGFHLYSVGWNQRDDSGVTAWRMEGKGRQQDFERGDWAWPE